MAEAKTKKKKTKNNEVKVNVWKIVNFLLIMISVIYLALIIEIVSVAAVAANASKGEEIYELTVDVIKHTNLTMNKAVVATMGIFAVAHFVNYVLYILKRRELLVIANIIELVIAVISLKQPFGLVILLPLLSGLVYLRILKLEKK